MRGAANRYHADRMLVRMSWHPQNLYSLFQRTFGPPATDTVFTRSNRSLYWQRNKSRALLRGYHGDMIPEKRFKAHWLPASLPLQPRPLMKPDGKVDSQNKSPITSLMFVELEKRIDVAIFRACMAPSVYEARRMIISGNVKLNGVRCTEAWTRLQPQDLVSIDPATIPMLSSTRPIAEKYGPPTIQGELPSKYQRWRKAPTTSSPESESALAETETTPIDGQGDASSAASTPTSTEASKEPLPFVLPAYASPFLFSPSHLEISYRLCSFIFLRAPTCGPGYSEVPSPWDADGEAVKFTWEWYSERGHGRRVRRARKASEREARERSDPHGEVWLRRRSAGGRIGRRGGRPSGGRIGERRTGPQGDTLAPPVYRLEA